MPDVQRTLARSFVRLALGQVVDGPLADRFGRNPPLYLGPALLALASAGCALTLVVRSPAGLRFVQVPGACAETIGCRAIVRDLIEDKAHGGSNRVAPEALPTMGRAPGGMLAMRVTRLYAANGVKVSSERKFERRDAGTIGAFSGRVGAEAVVLRRNGQP